MEQTPEETRERILQATGLLMRRHGFKAVTTKAIAKEAGVNESTLFRHFGSKKGIVEALVQRYSYMPLFRGLLDRLEGDLERDLAQMANAYQSFMRQNGDMVILALRDAGAFEELDERAASVPKEFKDCLIDYFASMRERGLLGDTDLEAQAMGFIWLNLGFFLSRSLFGDRITTVDQERFLQHSVAAFARGLRS
ncbi:TetR family transcriptional regulator [Paenibacillus sp. J31TS4]|uniref:TetR/AcrR family transcriptional regulator n=1 Tax=Paenibacillus sp. J31TS4 TaxID=2807195 RepID=UPI001B15528F|nr:TetR/AcrR family transcriptional regulator [Paenibacillus sp. J31TS4]GIP37023.1 TetR family transcriptional regulator [Paenibacillus sp. J31TS4]